MSNGNGNKKRSLILAGGGIKVAFQAGADVRFVAGWQGA